MTRPQTRRAAKAPPPTPQIDAPSAAPPADRATRPDVEEAPTQAPTEVQAPPPDSGTAPADLPEATVDEIVRSLNDAAPTGSEAWWHYRILVAELGADVARALVRSARAVEAEGGQPVEDGTRKRTTGGIFFALSRERVGAEKWRALRQLARQRFKASPRPADPPRSGPAPLPAFTTILRRRSRP